MKNNASYVRAFYYKFYSGTKYHCNICKKGLRKFIDTGSEEKVCPNCLSTSKDRSLWSILTSEYIDEQDQILHLSPAKQLKRNFENIPNIYYISTDYLKRINYKADDIFSTRDINKETFNLVICSKILEYLNDIDKTLEEIHRVLVRGGHCIIQTNLDFEDKKSKSANGDISFKTLKKSELFNKLSELGFDSEMINIESKSQNRLGLKSIEHLLAAKKV